MISKRRLKVVKRLPLLLLVIPQWWFLFKSQWSHSFSRSIFRQENQNVQSLAEKKAATLIWTYPTRHRPSENSSEEEPDLCAYHTCLESSSTATRLTINVTTLKPSFQEFWRRHHIYKVRYGMDFPHHVQAIALLSYVHQTGICARTPGTSILVCPEDLHRYEDYNPLNESSLLPQGLLSKENIFVGHFKIFSHDSRVARIRVGNSGDEIQTFGPLSFMPYVSGTIDRDKGMEEAEGYFFGNAWMGTSFSFPPKMDQANISLVSVHYSGKGFGIVKKNKGWYLKYNKVKGMIGARDTGTLQFLLNQGIEAYMSGCLTLTIGLGMKAYDNIDEPEKQIVVVDVKKKDLPFHILKDPGVIYLEAEFGGRQRTTHLRRMENAYKMLKTYRTRARVVITSRIHAALPATGMGIPVIFVDSNSLPGGGGGRTAGLLDVFRVYKPGTPWIFNETALEPYEGLHAADRWRASFWHVIKQQNPYYNDNAMLFDMIPIKRLGANIREQEEVHNLFRPIPRTMTNTLGKQNPSSTNGAILIFERHAEFMREALTRAFEKYKIGGEWGQVGPKLLTSMTANSQTNFTLLSKKVFYPYEWQRAKYCFKNDSSVNPTNESFSVHLNTKKTYNTKTMRGSVCSLLFSQFCIFCNDKDPLLEEQVSF